MRATSFLALVLPALLALGLPAAAHHPGDRLDEVMTGKEEYFQTIDRRAPGFELVDADGKPVALSEFADRIVVMHFINAGRSEGHTSELQSLMSISSAVFC